MALRLRSRRFLSLLNQFLYNKQKSATVFPPVSHLLHVFASPTLSSSTRFTTRPFTSTRSVFMYKKFDPETYKIGPDTDLHQEFDYNHWLITFDFPKDKKYSREQMIETYVNTAAQVFDSVEEAKKKIYAFRTTTYHGFQVECTEETSEKFKGLPGVVEVLPDPDSYNDPVTVAGTGNAEFLNDLLKAGFSPDVVDSKGRTPLHIAASKGDEQCVFVLLQHGCSLHLKDLNGNTALWDAIESKHHTVFKTLYHRASFSDPYIAGDLLIMAARRNDLTVMKELLRNGLYVDSKDRHGLTAIEVARNENYIDMVKFLQVKGSEVNEKVLFDKLSSISLEEILKKREMGHLIVMPETLYEQTPEQTPPHESGRTAQEVN